MNRAVSIHTHATTVREKRLEIQQRARVTVRERILRKEKGGEIM